MSPTELKDVDERIRKGLPGTAGRIPELDPIAAHYADVWSTLRASTPGDQPIALISIALLVGADGMHEMLPLLQTMDRTYFESQRERMERERKASERKAEAARRRRGR